MVDNRLGNSAEASSRRTGGNDNSCFNPFDSYLLDSLHEHTFSPSVFKNVISPGKEEDKGTPSRPGKKDFRWSIDHIAILNPAEIEEFPEEQIHSEGTDEKTEALIQGAIESFWSTQTHIAPSPLDQQVCQPRLVSLIEKGIIHSGSKLRKPDGYTGCVTSPGYSLFAKKKTDKVPGPGRDEVTQTMLTFPPNLDLEKLFGGCFQYNEETEGISAESAADANLSVNSLRRKLFSGAAKNECIQQESSAFSPATNLSASSADFSMRCESPCWLLDQDTREDESDSDQITHRGRGIEGGFSAFVSPAVSPIKFDGELDFGY